MFNPAIFCEPIETENVDARMDMIRELSRITPRAKSVREFTPEEIKTLRQIITRRFPGTSVRKYNGRKFKTVTIGRYEPFSVAEANEIRAVLRYFGIVAEWDREHMMMGDMPYSSWGSLCVDVNGRHPAFQDEETPEMITAWENA